LVYIKSNNHPDITFRNSHLALVQIEVALTNQLIIIGGNDLKPYLRTTFAGYPKSGKLQLVCHAKLR